MSIFSSSRQTGLPFFRSASVIRIGLLLLIILSFARVVWRLDANNLWWDESLSLQRAESDWGSLLRGEIVLFDGQDTLSTTDQHPFGFFVLLGLLVRLAGTDEFVLRLPAAMGATLLVPVIWAVACFGVRRTILPQGTPLVAVLLASLSPFFLYYGQEARMYTWLPGLALVSVYMILRWAEAATSASRWRYLGGYVLTTFFFLASHYFSVLLLPVHAVLFFGILYRRRRRLAWGIAGVLLFLGVLVGLAAAWIILSQPHSGRNFQPITIGILVPDLLNSFSLGLSVNISEVWWLDLVFGMTALVGSVWTLRKQTCIRAGSWIWLTGMLVPILLLLLINQVQPAYMNARHLALIGGFYLLLLAAGILVIWQWLKPAGAVLLGLLIVGMIYSSVNYYTLPKYGKDDFDALGAYLARELAPGDLLVLSPPEMLRLYRYYLPVDTIENGALQGAGVAWGSAPLLYSLDNAAALAPRLPDHRRVWVVTSGMVPFVDPMRTLRAWMDANSFQIRDVNFFSSQSFLELDLYLPVYPEVVSLPPEAVAVDADFDGKIHVAGYQISQPLTASSVIPVTLYWQAVQPLDANYKYLLYLEATGPNGEVTRMPVTEREPYDGYLPTTQWQPNQLWAEYTDVQLPVERWQPSAPTKLRLVLQIYDITTLETLPVHSAVQGQVDEEGRRLIFDFPVPAPDLQ